MCHNIKNVDPCVKISLKLNTCSHTELLFYHHKKTFILNYIVGKFNLALRTFWNPEFNCYLNTSNQNTGILGLQQK